MAEFKLFGSGGSIVADLTEEQAKAADLGVGKLFIAPVGKIDPSKISRHSCNNCKSNFDKPPNISIEENSTGAPERVAENLLLVERGQYVCIQCNSVVGNYRVFEKGDKDSEGTGFATPSST